MIPPGPQRATLAPDLAPDLTPGPACCESARLVRSSTCQYVRVLIMRSPGGLRDIRRCPIGHEEIDRCSVKPHSSYFLFVAASRGWRLDRPRSLESRRPSRANRKRSRESTPFSDGDREQRREQQDDERHDGRQADRAEHEFAEYCRRECNVHCTIARGHRLCRIQPGLNPPNESCQDSLRLRGA